MNRVQELRNRRKQINISVGDGEASFKVTIPLPTPYETQMILFDSLDKSVKDDEWKAGSKMMVKALAWMDENMPIIDGEKLSLNDLTNEEIEPVKEAIKDIFFRTDKKQAKPPRKKPVKK